MTRENEEGSPPMLDNPILKYGAILFIAFLIFSAPAEASSFGEGFGGTAVDFVGRVADFLEGLLRGANS